MSQLPPTPDAVLQLVKCACTKTRCSTNCCQCRKAGLVCKDLCQCSDTDDPCDSLTTAQDGEDENDFQLTSSRDEDEDVICSFLILFIVYIVNIV